MIKKREYVLPKCEYVYTGFTVIPRKEKITVIPELEKNSVIIDRFIIVETRGVASLRIDKSTILFFTHYLIYYETAYQVFLFFITLIVLNYLYDEKNYIKISNNNCIVF
jgi:hypothetical protein